MRKTENNNEIRKTEVLHIRLTPDDKQLIQQYAGMMNCSMAAFIEMLLHRKRIFICPDFPQLISQILRIGNNINQIARVGNENRHISKAQIEKTQELAKCSRKHLIDFINWCIEEDKNIPKSVGLHTGKAINSLADSICRLERRLEIIEKKL